MASKSKLLFVLFVIFQMTFLCCKEEKNPAEDYVSIYECHQKNNFDEAAIRNKIIGTWGWEYVTGGHFSPSGVHDTEISKGLKIKFNADGSGTIMAKDTTGVFTWTIEMRDTNHYEFKTTPFVSELRGRLLFCDDLMMCNSSIIDGPDHVFKKE